MCIRDRINEINSRTESIERLFAQEGRVNGERFNSLEFFIEVRLRSLFNDDRIFAEFLRDFDESLRQVESHLRRIHRAYVDIRAAGVSPSPTSVPAEAADAECRSSSIPETSDLSERPTGDTVRTGESTDEVVPPAVERSSPQPPNAADAELSPELRRIYAGIGNLVNILEENVSSLREEIESYARIDAEVVNGVGGNGVLTLAQQVMRNAESLERRLHTLSEGLEDEARGMADPLMEKVVAAREAASRLAAVVRERTPIAEVEPPLRSLLDGVREVSSSYDKFAAIIDGTPRPASTTAETSETPEETERPVSYTHLTLPTTPYV
jgi:hypothetical protein